MTRLSNVSFRDKIISIMVLAVFFITVWFMMDLAVLTFIFTFIFYYLLKFVKRLMSRTPLRHIPDGVTLLLLFLIGIAFIVLCSIAFVPILIDQTKNIANTFIYFDVNKILGELDPSIRNFINDMDFKPYLEKYLEKIGAILLAGIMNIGGITVELLLSIAISFILLLEKDKIHRFGEVMHKSRVAFIYHYFMVFGVNFCRTFGSVMKVQVTIAFVNSILSIIILGILGFKSIIWGLGVMIFLLGLVPVAGVIISLIPLTLIAFNLGGVSMVVKVLIMVALIHVVEAYVLNPKLMANRVRLPVSFVFIILLVSEKYLGVWGLLIGVPLFIFLMTIFSVDYQEAAPAKKHPPLIRGRLIPWLKKHKAS